jgi:peroxiredoxin
MKIFITIFLFIVYINCQSQTTNANLFVFSGKLVGADTGFVCLSYTDAEKKWMQDTARLNNGQFQFKGKINGPVLASFSGQRKSRSVDDPNYTEFFLTPGYIEAWVKVNTFKQIQVKGSAVQDEYEILLNKKDSLENAWSPLFKALAQARSSKDTALVNKLYRDDFPIYRALSKSIIRDFIRSYNNSVVSAYLLSVEPDLDLDSMKYYYALLGSTARNSMYGMRVSEAISKEEKVQIGSLAPDFFTTDMNGKSWSLSKLRGKYVLLEFWASWCIPCREEHPYLKEAYKQYANKGFEILAFSLDANEYKEAWLNAIKKDNLNWVQLCDFKVWKGDVVQLYNLFGKGIPANFLISPEGRILAKDLRGKALTKKLEELIR